MLTGNWMLEYRGDNRSNMYPIEQVIVNTQSQYQTILIAQTKAFGKALFLDGIPQSAQIDEHFYHEPLIHPTLVACEHPKKVFIAGGGEGAVLREILKHNTVERVVMVDIDAELIDLVKIHLPEWHEGMFDDPRVEVRCEDALQYLKDTDERFDCILGDLPDPLDEGPAAGLFTKDFYALVKSRLNDGGTFGLQTENTEIGWSKANIEILMNLQNSFEYVLPYQITIPFYGLPWGFAVASNAPIGERLNAESVERILHERGCADNLRLYDKETHLHMFSLPKHIRDALTDPTVRESLRNALPLADLRHE